MNGDKQKSFLEELSDIEKSVIEKKGTERPHSGKYNAHFNEGVYLCRRCGSPLYDSAAKFDAGCGWPSFNDEVPGAVRRTPDPDGIRTEISCVACDAHLGHVFTGEKSIGGDVRHCVNSTSLFFVPERFGPDEENYAVFGGGCFWCFEAIFKEVRGVKEVIPGYAGGRTPNPTYDKVSAGGTGHAETVKITFDPAQISFSELLEIFFSIHDPTEIDRQGADVGTQYRSVILYKTLEQKRQASESIAELNKGKVFSKKIATEVQPLYRFYPAEDWHRDYYEKNKDGNAYCRLVINPKLKKFRENNANLRITRQAVA